MIKGKKADDNFESPTLSPLLPVQVAIAFNFKNRILFNGTTPSASINGQSILNNI